MLTIEDKIDRVKKAMEESGEKLKKVYLPELDSIMYMSKYRVVILPYQAGGYLPGDVEIDRHGNWYKSLCDSRPVKLSAKTHWLRYKDHPRQSVYLLDAEDDFNYRVVAKKYIGDLIHKDALYFYDYDRALIWLLDQSDHEPYAIVCGIRSDKKVTTID